MVKVRPPPQAHAERAERAEGAEHPCHSGAEERLAVAPLPIRPPLAIQALREWQSAVQHHRLRRLRLGLRVLELSACVALGRREAAVWRPNPTPNPSPSPNPNPKPKPNPKPSPNPKPNPIPNPNPNPNPNP